jgi:rod shape-determining protein MreD
VKSVTALVLVVIVALLLRSAVLTTLSARGIVIDVLALVTVIWALRNRETWGASFGFILGLAADLDAAHWLGRHALVLTLLGYAVGRVSHTLVRDSSRTHAALLLVATLVHQSWVAAFELASPTAWPYLLQRVLLAAVVTAPVGTVLVALVQRLSGQSFFGHAASEPDPAA